MEKLFWVCVQIMKDLALITGYSYEEINIIIFVIIHPAITLLLFIGLMIFFILYLKERGKHR